MRILQVVNNLNTGGAEKLVADSVPLYHKKGIDTDVLLLNGKQAPLLERLESRDNINIYVLSMGSVYNPFLTLKMINFLKKYDIIHTHLFPALYWTALAKLFSRTKAKFIFTEHNTSNKRMKLPFLIPIENFIYSRYDKIVTISDQVDSNLRDYLSFTTDKIEQVNNGIDTKLFENTKAYNKEDFFRKEDNILIQVSSFRKQKDQKTLVEALKILPDNVKLLLVGDGPLKKECKKLVCGLNLKDRVKFLGIRMDVPSLLKTADIVVLSSYYEGLSLSSLEGMASGNPFLASDVPGLKKVVSGAGLLFEQGDEEKLAEHIQHLLNDRVYYAEIARRCSKRARKFDISTMVDKYIKIYKEL